MIRTVNLVMLILGACLSLVGLGQQTATHRTIANYQATASQLEQFAGLRQALGRLSPEGTRDGGFFI